jgi:hypothetical protein
MGKTFRWVTPILLVSVIGVGCGHNTAAPATVTVSTTVTDIKTVAEVQTAIVAPPAQVNTVTVTQTVTLAGSAVAQTSTTVSGSTGRTVTFDSAKVASGVRKILTDAPPAGYGITGVTDTSCPNDQPVRTGRTFLCHATIDNASKSVRITVKDDAGTYQVGTPG